MVRHSRAPQWRGATGLWSVAWQLDGAGYATRLLLASTVLTMASLIIAYTSGLVATPVGPRADVSTPVAEVLTYVGNWRGPGLDPLVTLPSGVQVKSSNYRGVQIGDTTYYYNLAPHTSFDPLARGVVTSDQIQVVAVVGDPPDRVMIYTIKH